MIDLDKIICCGCRLCSDVCPAECIDIQEDEYGFIKPFINQNNCINCGICENKCPSLNIPELKNSIEGYAGFSKNNDERYNGSSGGIFGVLAKEIIKLGGVVFGAAFDENLCLVQMKAEKESDLNALYKSKYLQCNMAGFYREIKLELDSGKTVLVCNTPCNLAALKNYLNKEYENLITVDFVCHGVPSQKFFDKCIKWYEENKGIKIIEYSFREKKKGGTTPHLFKIKYIKNNKIKEKLDLYLKEPFYNAFQKRLSMRESCYKCQYAIPERVSDVTIGDFHNIDKYKKGLNRMDGVSMILINSDKGKCLFEKIKNKLVIEKFDTETLIENNECLNAASKMPENRNRFLEILKNDNIDLLCEGILNYKKDWKSILYYSLPKFIRNVLKKIIIGE